MTAAAHDPAPLDDPAPPDDLRVALAAADAADAVTRARYRAVDLQVRDKPDQTPVTDADLAAERAVRDHLGAARPSDAVLGEEDGLSAGAPAAERRWVVDPVDGTKNFLRGVPVWATLLALQVAGEPQVAVVSAPALGRRWWAARGHGSWVREADLPPRRCRVSQVEALADASVSLSSLSGWQERGRLPAVLQLSERVWRLRGYGDFWSHCLVAEGAVDVAAEPEVSLWDLAPLQLLVEEAGGTFTDLSGRSWADGGSAVSTNGRLHPVVLQLLTGAA